MSPGNASPRIAAIDLFCGVGGLTHGLILGGIEVKTGYDIDAACRYPYEANNSATFIQCDVAKLTADEIRKAFGRADLTLLAGCAPCQPFSTYSRSGRSKKRALDWQLVPKFGRLIREVQPDLVTMENVSQLVDHSAFKEFLDQLTGYHVKWAVIECSDFGVPQSRRRLVLLASRLGPDGLEMPKESGVTCTVRDKISELPKLDAGEQNDEDRLHKASSLSPLNLQRIRASLPGGTWRDWDPSLRAACHYKATGASYPSVYGRMEWDKVAPTITTQCFGYGNGRFGHPERDRAISLREAAMLQTFPRNYKFVPPGEPILFARLGRWIGNAVPVRVGEVIGEVLRSHVGLYK
ncbi:DNA cytosine methyltransferase [Trebonia sp.]|uniref:DNA cytosine methyltransferase n=1 Tax=Trebonia sp. TaxID=2767075 RepID=UPI002634133E|nr:DNA cytosine methyltransferase [Trebonia sp.]